MKSIKHLDQFEASKRLAVQFDELKEEIEFLSNKNNFAGILQLLVNKLMFYAEIGQIRKVNRRIQKVGSLYNSGNEYIRFLIENLFVRSFRGLKRRSSSIQWKAIFDALPNSLRSLYLQQNQTQLI